MIILVFLPIQRVIISTALDMAMLHVSRSQNFLGKACRHSFQVTNQKVHRRQFFPGQETATSWHIFCCDSFEHVGTGPRLDGSHNRNYNPLIQCGSWTKCRAYELSGPCFCCSTRVYEKPWTCVHYMLFFGTVCIIFLL